MLKVVWILTGQMVVVHSEIKADTNGLQHKLIYYLPSYKID